jgi:hypothetical protein
MVIGSGHRGWSSPSRGYCWGRAKGITQRVSNSYPRELGSNKRRASVRAFFLKQVRNSILQGCGVLPEPRGGSLKASPDATSWGPQRSDRAKLVMRRRWRAEARCLEEATEQRLTQSRLHMAAADWCAPEAITWCNSLNCPIDCVIYNWGRWLRALKTLWQDYWFSPINTPPQALSSGRMKWFCFPCKLPCVTFVLFPLL